MEQHIKLLERDRNRLRKLAGHVSQVPVLKVATTGVTDSHFDNMWADNDEMHREGNKLRTRNEQQPTLTDEDHASEPPGKVMGSQQLSPPPPLPEDSAWGQAAEGQYRTHGANLMTQTSSMAQGCTTAQATSHSLVRSDRGASVSMMQMHHVTAQFQPYSNQLIPGLHINAATPRPFVPALETMDEGRLYAQRMSIPNSSAMAIRPSTLQYPLVAPLPQASLNARHMWGPNHSMY